MYSYAPSQERAGSWFCCMAVLPSGRLLAGEHRAEQSRGKPSRAECSEQQKWPVCRSARTLLITLNLSSLPINITLIIPSSNKPGYLVFLPMAHTRKGWGESARGRHTVHSKKWQCPSSSKEGNGGTITISISSAVLAAWEQRKSLHGENSHLQPQQALRPVTHCPSQ